MVHGHFYRSSWFVYFFSPTRRRELHINVLKKKRRERSQNVTDIKSLQPTLKQVKRLLQRRHSIVVVTKGVNLSKFSHVNYSSNRMVVFIYLCSPNSNIKLKHDFL